MLIEVGIRSLSFFGTGGGLGGGGMYIHSGRTANAGVEGWGRGGSEYEVTKGIIASLGDDAEASYL